MNLITFFSILLVFLMTIDLGFTAHYGNQCSQEDEQEQQCSDTETCCSRTVTSVDEEGNELIEEVSAGCCAYKDGVCCTETDGCCPNGYTCDSKNRRCSKEQPQPQPVADINLDQSAIVLCPDQSICSAWQTCCFIGLGSYGCCPYESAVCCSDLSGCCPHGYQCEGATCKNLLGESLSASSKLASATLSQSVATRSVEEETEMLTLTKKEWNGQYITCPNGSQCLSGHTCCKLDDSSRLTTPYACCPYYEALCCKNSEYCCPKNRPCDPNTNECLTKPATRDAPAESTPAFRMF